MIDIQERWESITEESDDFSEFEKIENKRSQRPDVHAFLLLDELFPGGSDLIDYAGHDEIGLDICDEQVATLTDDQILELNRCGVRYDYENGGLVMWVWR